MKKKLIISLTFNVLLALFLLIIVIYLFSSRQYPGSDQSGKDVKGITVDTFNPIPTPLQLALNGQAFNIDCKKSEDIFRPMRPDEQPSIVYTNPDDISELSAVLDEPKTIVFMPKSADGTIYTFKDNGNFQGWAWGWGKFEKDADNSELSTAFDKAREVRDRINTNSGTGYIYNGQAVSPGMISLSTKVKCDDGDFISLTMSSPLVYLYNTKSEPVSVKVKSPVISGAVKLGSDGFWNVITSPDGTFTSQDGKKHKFIPYEFLRYDFKRPVKGFVVEKEKLEEYLKTDLWKKLGLTDSEISDYWMDTKPRVKPSPYYFVSLIDRAEIERVLPMETSPKPDTIIRNMTYILPLNKPFTPKPLDQEKLNAPKREGFTLLENGVFTDGF